MKRVCMVAYTVYDWDARIRREAETLAATGEYEVRVLALKTDEVARDYVLNGICVQQLNVRKYRGKNPLKYIGSYLIFTLRALIAVRQLARRKAVDVVHIHNMPNFLVAAALVPRLQGKTVVLDIHDTMPETFSATFSPKYRKLFLPILNLEERLCCAAADRIVTVNQVQQDAIVARQPWSRRKMIVSMNVPDRRLFTARDSAAAMDPRGSDRFRLVYHGTVSGRLGVRLAVEAVARCIERIPEIQLNIIGRGDAKERLVQDCTDRSLTDHVVFHDAVPLDDLVPMVRDMDLGIVPLESNPATELMLPVKLMECLSLGIPVVAPRLKAICHYFTEDMLFFFEPGDVVSMEAAIIAARDPEARRARVRNAQAFLEQYDWTVHQAAFLDLYRSA
jgi:glycosyltransferase involved in cell wall biosynthesis